MEAVIYQTTLEFGLCYDMRGEGLDPTAVVLNDIDFCRELHVPESAKPYAKWPSEDVKAVRLYVTSDAKHGGDRRLTHAEFVHEGPALDADGNRIFPISARGEIVKPATAYQVVELAEHYADQIYDAELTAFDDCDD